MINALEHLDDFRLTTRMIVEEAGRRGWQVQAYYPGAARLRITRPDGQVLETFGASSPVMSYITGISTNDKYVAHTLLAEQSLPVLATTLVRSEAAAVEACQNFFNENKTVVIKPLDDGHGNGVTVAITDAQKAREAFALAQKFSNRTLVQEQFDNATDLRLLVIGYTFRAALIRTPARVIGDGTHNIEELIKLENAQPTRGLSYSKKLSFIDPEAASKFLGPRLADIPQAGESMAVVGTANVGTGGETIDITDVVPTWLIAVAEKAAKALRSPVCGVDFLVKKVPALDDQPSDLDPKIIELNKSPALFIHEPPIHGNSHPVVAWYIDYLETLTSL